MNALKPLWAFVIAAAALLALGRIVVWMRPNPYDFAMGWAAGAIGTVVLACLAVIWFRAASFDRRNGTGPLMSVVFAVGLLVLTGCSQWGTFTADVWWACRDRFEKCSPEDSALTFVQMDNVLRAVRKDASSLEAGPKKERLLAAIHDAETARARIAMPPMWGNDLADYVQASINAERISFGMRVWKVSSRRESGR